jgi:hypothetical protein
MALGVVLISLVIAVMTMAKNNTGDITTTFSDTAVPMRNMDKRISAGAEKLCLLKSGRGW